MAAACFIYRAMILVPNLCSFSCCRTLPHSKWEPVGGDEPENFSYFGSGLGDYLIHSDCLVRCGVVLVRLNRPNEVLYAVDCCLNEIVQLPPTYTE